MTLTNRQGTWKSSIWVSTIHGPGRQTFRYGTRSICFKMHISTLKGCCCQFWRLVWRRGLQETTSNCICKKNLWGDRCGWLNLDLQQVTMVRSCYPAIFYHLLSASKVLVHRPSQVGSKTLNSPTVHRFRLAHLWKGLNIVLETGQRFATGRWGQISHGCSLCLMAWAWVMAVVACLHENVWDAWACIFEVQSVVTDPLHR